MMSSPESVRDNGDRRVEADAELGLRQIVVDRLRDTNDSHALRIQPLGNAQRVVSTDRDESIESPALNTFEHGSARLLVLAGIGPRRPEHRPAVSQNARDVPGHERTWFGLSEQPGPAVGDAEDLVTEGCRAEDDRADRRVQPGGVAAAGEDSDAQR